MTPVVALVSAAVGHTLRPTVRIDCDARLKGLGFLSR